MWATHFAGTLRNKHKKELHSNKEKEDIYTRVYVRHAVCEKRQPRQTTKESFRAHHPANKVVPANVFKGTLSPRIPHSNGRTPEYYLLAPANKRLIRQRGS